MASGPPRRTHLSLEQKVEVIKTAGDLPGITLRSLAELFNCGKTQISCILKNKDSILASFESNASPSKQGRASKFSDVNEALYQWYCLACSKNVQPNGPQLVEKAREIAARLGKSEFIGTNGWLSKWKKHYNISKIAICGESGDVSGETATSWKERLPEILRGYDAEDIYNLDETGCFWKALPDHGFVQKGGQCKGGKKSKQRFTIAFLVSAAGDKEPPIVIWNRENPRCFRDFDKNSLPVKYYHQRKSWMTGGILDSVLLAFNLKMKAEGRSVVLLLDNAGCHPRELQGKYSNIKIVFLPPSGASKLQPLNLGIICNFKSHYRRLLLQYVISKMNSCSSASEVTSSINVLGAIRWVATAWTEVKPETIVKCFKQAGIVDGVHTPSKASLFEYIDLTMGSLISTTMGALDACSVEEYVTGDRDLAVCIDLNDDKWEENFMDNLAQEEATEQDSDVDEEFDVLPPSPKIKSYKEAIQSLEDVQTFLESRGCLEAANDAFTLINQLAAQHVSTLSTQTNLDQYCNH